ncbi:cupin domain-containing protein [Paenibacillus methanolicus]|uniref:Cupin n=1 Tax=Paenibacillus methanolicus TaxID=582686 RepID=A0A5S5CIE8_9BACL|nr:cupin domain-containing protein [Paenibacillus methanolicus]TYP79492.1 Cupin [Paenibacillus methanolicus]
MNANVDFTSPDARFFFDLTKNQTTKKDAQNYMNTLSINQLNTLGNVSLLDIYLSKSNIVEPHVHQNASELVYLVSGGAVVSLINPFTKQLIHIPVAPGQVANVPQGWWHYEIATEDNTHIIAIFDAPVPEFIAGSDLLRLTPASVFAHSYCLDETKVKETLAPITDTVVIGPPSGCHAAAPHSPAQPQPQAHRSPHAYDYYGQTISQAAHDANEPSAVPGNGWQGWQKRNSW